jgi:hypothetical protein
MTIIDKCWNLQHKIENKHFTNSLDNLSFNLENKSTSLYDILMYRFFWEILTLILSASFWYFLFHSLSFNKHDSLQFFWLINAPLFTTGLIIMLLLDIRDYYFYRKNYKIILEIFKKI